MPLDRSFHAASAKGCFSLWKLRFSKGVYKDGMEGRIVEMESGFPPSKVVFHGNQMPNRQNISRPNALKTAECGLNSIGNWGI